MAESHVNNSLAAEAFHVAYVAAYGVAVFYSFHYGVLSLAFQRIKVMRRAGKLYALRFRHHFVYTCEYVVRLGRSCRQGSLVACALRQISHHNRGIQTAFFHLVQINKHLRVAARKVYVPVKEHGCVAMGVERKHAAVKVFGRTFVKTTRCPVICRFSYNPLEKRLHGAVACGSKAFRMPLHAQYRLVFRAFHGFYHAVGRNGRDF